MNKLVKILASVAGIIVLPSLIFASEGGGAHLPDAIGTFFHSETMTLFKPIFYTSLISGLFCFATWRVYRKREMIPG